MPAPSRPSTARDPLGWAITQLALAASVASVVRWRTGGGTIDVPWAAELDRRLHLRFGRLGALYALLATGVGTAVFAYATPYLPLHLDQQARPARDRWRFWPWMGPFAASMVGLATAQDLILLSYPCGVPYSLDAALALAALSFVATLAAVRSDGGGGPFLIALGVTVAAITVYGVVRLYGLCARLQAASTASMLGTVAILAASVRRPHGRST